MRSTPRYLPSSLSLLTSELTPGAGCVFETTITTIGERGFTLEKIVLWATSRTATGSSKDSKDDQQLPPDEALAVKFLQRCFELDPARRMSAEEALEHEFLNMEEEG